MKYFKILCVLSISLLFINPTFAEAPERKQKTSWTKEEVLEIIEERANYYDVSADLMTKIVHCESSFQRLAVGDGGNSIGLAQIYLKYHPSVTREDAENPEFAMNFLAYNLSIDNGKIWTCYNMIKKGS